MSAIANAPSRRTVLRKSKSTVGSKAAAQPGEKGAERVLMRTLKVLLQVMSLAVVALTDYVLAMWVAITAIPAAMTSVATSLGFTPETANINSFAVWGISSLALAVFLVVLGLLAMRGVWRLRRRALGWVHLKWEGRA